MMHLGHGRGAAEGRERITASPERPSFRFGIAALLAGGAIVGAGALFGALLPFPGDDAARRLCDQAVATLLHSKDLVEVQRAGIIIHEVSCGISRRLTDDSGARW